MRQRSTAPQSPDSKSKRLLVAIVLVGTLLITWLKWPSANPAGPGDGASSAEPLTHESLADLLIKDEDVRRLLGGESVTAEGVLANSQIWTNPDDRKATVSRMELAMTLQMISEKAGPAEALPFMTTFSDVSASHPAFSAIVNVTSHSWMEPKSGAFQPASPATRAEVDKALRALLKK